MVSKGDETMRQSTLTNSLAVWSGTVPSNQHVTQIHQQPAAECPGNQGHQDRSSLSGLEHTSSKVESHAPGSDKIAPHQSHEHRMVHSSLAELLRENSSAIKVEHDCDGGADGSTGTSAEISKTEELSSCAQNAACLKQCHTITGNMVVSSEFVSSPSTVLEIGSKVFPSDCSYKSYDAALPSCGTTSFLNPVLHAQLGTGKSMEIRTAHALTQQGSPYMDDFSQHSLLTRSAHPGTHVMPISEYMPNTQDPYPFSSWTRTHPENWNSDEVLDWLFYTTAEQQLDFSLLHAEAFQCVGGYQLCGMSRQKFLELEPQFGDVLYDTLHRILKEANFNEPAFSPEAIFVDRGGYAEVIDKVAISRCHRSLSDASDVPSYLATYDSSPRLPIRCRESGLDKVDPFDEDNSDYDTELDELFIPDESHCSYPVNPAPPPYATISFNNARADIGYTGFVTYDTTNGHIARTDEDVSIRRRRPGRPRKTYSVRDNGKIKRDKKRTVKQQQLWEFLYMALMNQRYSPQYLRWENMQEGVFKFVHSERVAQLWGSLKNNDNMNYEKLSRAMRHYYKRGILERVEGRRLVYKFTPLAMKLMREKLHSS